MLWGVAIVHSAEVTLVRDARLGHSPSIGERFALVVISWSVWSQSFGPDGLPPMRKPARQPPSSALHRVPMEVI